MRARAEGLDVRACGAREVRAVPNASHGCVRVASVVRVRLAEIGETTGRASCRPGALLGHRGMEPWGRGAVLSIPAKERDGAGRNYWPCFDMHEAEVATEGSASGLTC